MEMLDALRTAIQDWVVPEFDKIRLENAEIRSTLQLTNKRLDDIHQQLIDQSRRIDETNKRIDKVHDDLLTRIDKLNTELRARIDKFNTDLTARIDKFHADFIARSDKVLNDLIRRNDETNGRLDRLYEVNVRREEHALLSAQVQELRARIEALEQRIAA